MEYHKPVLLNEVLDYLDVSFGKKYIDCTLGDGGHTIEILKRGGRVLGIDSNAESIERAKGRVQEGNLEENITFVRGNFSNLKNIVLENDFVQVSGIIFDLGYSSSQLIDPNLGISFSDNQKLDMRLDDSLGVTATDLVNALSVDQLTKLFYEYGEERNAKKFAQAIVSARSLKKIQTTSQLVDVLVDAVSPGYAARQKLHIATKVFQALRIAVNSELSNLELVLPQAASLLLPGGRMIVISFHSLEDRIVKRFGSMDLQSLKVLTEKPIVPSFEEIRENPRSRSSKMRVFERLN